MILDTHDNLHHYAGLFRDFDPQRLFEWLRACRDVLPGEKLDFAGDKLFAKVLRQNTAAREVLKWETHREYIDLQYVLGGGEVIEWVPAAKLVADGPYDEIADVQFYEPAQPEARLAMQDGLFTVLLPSDGHKPGVSNGADRHVHKVVVKVHRSLMVI